MRVHHINCGTMCPLGGPLVGPERGLFSTARMLCHCLLIETRDGLVLVDTGFGTDDVADPRGQLGAPFVTLARPRNGPDDTALAQIVKLGYRRDDVRHIVPTHLDVDHAGGLRDFPAATVHLFAPEHAAAMARTSLRERERYHPSQWAHGPKWQLHDVARGERWFGFDAARTLGDDAGADVLIVPLTGHTRGHAGVAVRTTEGWLLHAGDAYFFHREMDAAPFAPLGLRLFQRAVSMDERARVANQRRLRELVATHGDEVKVFSAHSPIEFGRYGAGETIADAPAVAKRA